jgi:hypothetical protein
MAKDGKWEPALMHTYNLLYVKVGERHPAFCKRVLMSLSISKDHFKANLLVGTQDFGKMAFRGKELSVERLTAD